MQASGEALDGIGEGIAIGINGVPLISNIPMGLWRRKILTDEIRCADAFWSTIMILTFEFLLLKFEDDSSTHHFLSFTHPYPDFELLIIVEHFGQIVFLRERIERPMSGSLHQ
jgi:hypothetical protein